MVLFLSPVLAALVLQLYQKTQIATFSLRPAGNAAFLVSKSKLRVENKT